MFYRILMTSFNNFEKEVLYPPLCVHLCRFPFLSRVQLSKLLLFAKRNTRSLFPPRINCFSAISIPRRSTKERIVPKDLFVREMNQNFDSRQTINMTFRVESDVSLLFRVDSQWIVRRKEKKILGTIWL